MIFLLSVLIICVLLLMSIYGYLKNKENLALSSFLIAFTLYISMLLLNKKIPDKEIFQKEEIQKYEYDYSKI